MTSSDQRAVDSHVHVLGPGYPFDPATTWKPDPSQMGTVRNFRDVLASHGLTHGLLVGAQPYGRDNRCMLDAIASAPPGRLKGIALVDPAASERELAQLHDGGVVGIRVNLRTYGLRELLEPGADALLARIREMGWFLQIQFEKDQLVEAAPLLRKTGLRVMFDHFGRPDIAAGTGQAGFATMLEFGRHDGAIVKLSGPFRSSEQGVPYRDVDPFIAAAIEAFTLDRCVWGSDWPFLKVAERIDYGPQLDCVARWLPDPADRRRVLWETPARLFGFR
ncbi:MAG: amidohydrolase [Lautropia sp.]